jgi:hypothetical protein
MSSVFGSSLIKNFKSKIIAAFRAYFRRFTPSQREEIHREKCKKSAILRRGNPYMIYPPSHPCYISHIYRTVLYFTYISSFQSLYPPSHPCYNFTCMSSFQLSSISAGDCGGSGGGDDDWGGVERQESHAPGRAGPGRPQLCLKSVRFPKCTYLNSCCNMYII